MWCEYAHPLLKMNEVPFEEAERRMMGGFEGFDSAFYYSICSTNQYTLDQYRWIPHKEPCMVCCR